QTLVARNRSSANVEKRSSLDVIRSFQTHNACQQCPANTSRSCGDGDGGGSSCWFQANCVCDMQDKFRNAIWEFDKIVLTSQKVIRAAHLLSIPIYATTQNRAKLGPTVPELDELLTAAGPLVREHSDKTKFSMWTPSVQRTLAARDLLGGNGSGRITVALVGIESHICVTQTALDLLRAGHGVYVLADGVSSCNREEVPLALARLRAEGAVVTSSEAWLYEVMGDAEIPEFRSIVGLVKKTSADTAKVLQALRPARM
ncbi:hypothetical protein PspLS_08401, partial [Pyricularia sp. CBS 133598]